MNPIGFALVLTVLSAHAQAAFNCGGSLTDAQAQGFKALFTPPHSPSLSQVGPTVAPKDFSKTLTKAQLQKLTTDKPLVAATTILNEAGAKFLKEEFNSNAQASVPGWFATAISAFVPVAWLGITADVMVQLVNGQGDAGRLSLANLAGTVGPGGNVAVLERVAKDADGKLKFIWAYSHTANLNGKPTTSLLYVCSADVVVMP